jgi:2',3'-cyclic-nucleotide 2'-phosphodiesterase (5'-nucleotidase family)
MFLYICGISKNSEHETDLCKVSDGGDVCRRLPVYFLPDRTRTTAQYEVTKVEGSMITIDSVWDTNPNVKATEILKPYKEKVDAMMYEVIGTSAMKMDKGGPESLLSNLVAGVLQQAAVQVLGKPADMGLVNMGGLRNILPEGDITVGDVFEILPFENSLCVLTMKGTDLRRLFEAIASLHGEGVSGIRLEITKNGKLLNAFVGEKPLKDDQLYTVAISTIWQMEMDGWMLSCRQKREYARRRNLTRTIS